MFKRKPCDDAGLLSLEKVIFQTEIILYDKINREIENRLEEENMMKPEMRRKDRQLTAEETMAIIKENKYGILSTICEDGYPYGLPISYVYDEGKLYFHHTAHQGQIGENIKGEVKACFTVVGNTELLPAKFSTNYESVIAFGKIKACPDKFGVLMRLVKGLSPDFAEQGEKYARGSMDQVTVYEFEIEQMTGKARR